MNLRKVTWPHNYRSQFGHCFGLKPGATCWSHMSHMSHINSPQLNPAKIFKPDPGRWIKMTHHSQWNSCPMVSLMASRHSKMQVTMLSQSEGIFGTTVCTKMYWRWEGSSRWQSRIILWIESMRRSSAFQFFCWIPYQESTNLKTVWDFRLCFDQWKPTQFFYEKRARLQAFALWQFCSLARHLQWCATSCHPCWRLRRHYRQSKCWGHEYAFTHLREIMILEFSPWRCFFRRTGEKKSQASWSLGGNLFQAKRQSNIICQHITKLF